MATLGATVSTATFVPAPGSPVTFTQTYSTTATTVPAATAGAVSDLTTLLTEVPKLVTDVGELRKLLNSIIDILQSCRTGGVM